MKLKSKILFWFLLPTILISTITIILCYFHTCKIVKQNIFDQLEIAAGNLQKDVHAFLDAKRGRAIDFSSDGFIRDCTEAIITKNDNFRYYTERLNTHLSENKLSLDSDIVEIFIVDLEGTVISSTKIKHTGNDVSDKFYFSETVKRGSYINDLHDSPDSGFKIFEVSKILFSKDGKKTIGIIVNRYNGDALSRIASGRIKESSGVEKKGFGETGKSYVVNSERLMITESRFIEDAVFKQVVDTDGVRHAFDTRTGMTCIYPDYRGIMILGVSKYFEEMDWVILAEKDVDEAFAPVVWLRNFTIVMGVSGILIIVVISIFISTGITTPINKLIDGTNRISSGNLEKPISTSEMSGEIMELSESFNVMMRKLAISTQENRLLYLQVKKGRDEWRKTFDAITDIISIHDKNHKIVMANKAFYEKFKIDKKDMIGKKCSEIFHGTDTYWHCCPLEKSKKTLKPVSTIVDDTHMGGIFIKSIYPISDEKGDIYTYVHIAKDITLQKELQAELIEKARELEKVNNELEDFIYLTSHDLKEPLFAISGYTSRLSKTYNHVYDEKGRKYVNRIKANTHKMNQRIHEIMEVLRAGKIEYKHKSNDSFIIVNEVINELRERIVENEVKISINDNLPTVYCDETRIKDVFSNLIINAVKFMGNGRPSEFSHCKSPDLPLNFPELSLSYGDKYDGFNAHLRSITIGCENDESYCKFFIEDTGIGIQKEYQDQIFKIFKRLNDVDVEGTGVGLTMVKKIVEKHQGSIWVESPVRDGRGSRFCFTIPLSNK
ncbi:MAG: HAMP domain-containing protein [Candidatus Scalindua sp.]|jgi:PAS domain S-box-containing protein|nr:HAMP domain-containing protein [Candidatus Scalindua sp.]MBT5305600.1 HAMP domain-containing protein [Candidatus Scalindua sp.]MBT6047599.1 HAMP domain-containing protein [Candidatus Scalindua sp.]MBT6563924.1 HAMP domain-containing protein [Candidatus Scalindua sp.]MBT7212264.1 HAMP domain-containing protein [Candidatus Scalindua sp.]